MMFTISGEEGRKGSIHVHMALTAQKPLVRVAFSQILSSAIHLDGAHLEKGR
jgi:hypothetical protein